MTSSSGGTLTGGERALELLAGCAAAIRADASVDPLSTTTTSYDGAPA